MLCGIYVVVSLSVFIYELCVADCVCCLVCVDVVFCDICVMSDIVICVWMCGLRRVLPVAVLYVACVASSFGLSMCVLCCFFLRCIDMCLFLLCWVVGGFCRYDWCAFY